jgi:hypothetical protein
VPTAAKVLKNHTLGDRLTDEGDYCSSSLINKDEWLIWVKGLSKWALLRRYCNRVHSGNPVACAAIGHRCVCWGTYSTGSQLARSLKMKLNLVTLLGAAELSMTTASPSLPTIRGRYGFRNIVLFGSSMNSHNAPTHEARVSSPLRETGYQPNQPYTLIRKRCCFTFSTLLKVVGAEMVGPFSP